MTPNRSRLLVFALSCFLSDGMITNTDAVDESDFGFGDNVGEVQFNNDPVVAVVNEFSRVDTSASVTSSNQFDGEFKVEFLPTEQEATQILITHKSKIENTSSTAASSELENNFVYVLNKTFFEPFDPNSSVTEDTLNISVMFDAIADDPISNPNNTFLAAGVEIDIFGSSLTPFFTSNGLFSFDSATGPPAFSGSFDGNSTATDNGNGNFTNSVTISDSTPLVGFNQTYGVDAETFLQITNVETFGSNQSTGLDSSNTFVLSITGANAATRFRRIQVDGVVQPDALIQNKGQNVIRNRPSNRQTFKTTVTRRKRVKWRIENNGPVVNLDNGARSIISKGPRNSSRQRFQYFNRSEGRQNITGNVVRGRFILAPHAPGQGDNIDVNVISKRRKFGKRRLNSFNLTSRTPAGRKDVVRLRVQSN